MGAVTGAFIDSNNVFQGYSRSPQGTYTTFSAKGAGTGAYQGTRPSTNNLEGDVAGWWLDPTGLTHGFVWYSDGRYLWERDSDASPLTITQSAGAASIEQ
jgi:hypothetical protein